MAEILEEIEYQDPVPKPTLSKEHRAKLDSIVHQMVTNKESDSTIQSVVNDFKSRYIGATEAPTAKQQTAEFKPMTDWLKMPEGGYTPLMKDAVVDNSHFKNTNEAADRIIKSLETIDPHIKNLLYDVKKDLQGRVKSQELAVNPTEAVSLNPQAALIESQLREEPKVEDKEVEEYKIEMGGNANMVRNALKQQVYDLSKIDPERANQIKADVYRLDRQEYPANESKISNNVKKLKDGSFDYDVQRGILTKPEGFFGSLVTGFKHKNQLFKDYEFYTKGGNDNEIIRDLNAKIDDVDPDKPVPVADGFLGEAGAMIGGQPIKPVVGGVIAGAFTTPVGGAVGGGAIGSHEMYKLGYASALPQNYAAIKRENPDIPDEEAYAKAKSLTEKQAITDAGTGAVMGLVGLRMGLKPTGISLAFQKSLRAGLNQLAKVGVEKGIEGLIGGEAGALGQQVKNVLAQRAGITVDTDEGVIDQLVAGVGMTMGMALLTKFPKLLKPSTYNRLSYEMSKMPTEVIAHEGQQLQETGVATPEQVQEAQSNINSQRNINNSIRGNVSESEKVKIQEKINKRNALEAEMEVADKAFHPDLKEKIKLLNEEIVDISKGAEKGELQKIVSDADIEGYASDILKNASEKELKTYFKEIAEQAHDPNSAKLTVETFGEDIVNKAKELYPSKEVSAELKVIEDARNKDINDIEDRMAIASEDEIPSLRKELDRINEYYDNQITEAKSKDKIVEQETEVMPTDKKSGVSVIQPEEIKRPETITIKPKEDGVRSTETEMGGEPEVVHESGQEATGRNEGTTPSKGDAGSENQSAPPAPEGQVSEPEMVGITHAEMDKVSKELGLPEYSKDPETFDQWTAAAKEKLAKDPGAINNLMNKLRNGDTPDPVETQMMKMHFAALKERYNANPTPELLNEINRTKNLYNIAGRQQGKQLVARKGLMPVEDSLADFHMRDVEFNNNAPLTEEQVAQSTKEYNEIKGARDAFEAKVATLEAENAKLKAEKKVQAEAKIAKRDAKKDYKSERQQILKDISDKWRRSSKGDLGSSFMPYAKELAAITPDVMKLVRNVVAEGVEKLPDVIKAVHAQLKDVLPNVTERDVHDIIAGEHSKKQTRSQLAEQLYDLRKEAKLMNELDQLLQGEVPTNERRLRRRNQRIEELKSQIKELKDEMGLNQRTDEERLASLKGRYKSKIKEIEDKIAKGDYGPDEKPEPIKLDQEAIDLKDKMIKLKNEREARLAQQEYENRNNIQKAKDTAADALDAVRTLQTNPDMSFFGRQGIKYFVTHPVKGSKLFWESAKQAVSQKKYDRWLHDMHNSPAWKLIEDSGLAVLDPNTLHASKREEQWRSKLIHKIPIAGPVAKMSERAFTSAANMARVDWFMEGVKILRDQGKTFENAPEEYKGWASAVNNMTGRGGLGAFEPVAGQLAIPFWSPRLIASNVNLFLNPKYYMNLPKTARIMLLKNMAQYIITGAGVLGFAHLLGADTELDPRSSDFGKIKVGDTRYDVWGGAAQYIRAVAQFFMAARKSNGGIEKLDAKGQAIVIANLVRSKLSPLIGFGADVTFGKNIVGEDVELKDAYKLMIPMLWNDISDAQKSGGADAAAISGILSFLGIGAQTYGQRSSSNTSGRPHRREKLTKHSKNTKK